MSDEPSFDFLPWEELPVGVRRNRKKMYNYLVSVLGGGPTPPTPTGTGTVTVTCVDSKETPLEFAYVGLNIDEEHPIAGGNTGSDGTVILETLTEQGEPTGTVADVPYGDYLLFGSYFDESTSTDYTYSGELTVDGDENVTITLTEE